MSVIATFIIQRPSEISTTIYIGSVLKTHFIPINPISPVVPNYNDSCVLHTFSVCKHLTIIILIVNIEINFN